MKFREFLSGKAVTLCFLLSGMLLLSLVLFLFGAAGQLILLAALFLALATAAWLCCSYLYERAKITKLEKTAAMLAEKYLLGELLPRPASALERRYYEVVKAVSRSAVGAVEQARREKDEYRDYVESWIHELKTPLTACSLILSNDADKTKLKRELKRADNLTESILYYARLRTAEKDTQIQKTEVAEVMNEAIKSQFELLSAVGISVTAEGGFETFTDPKTLCFVLKQLLINCAKYCPAAKVTLTALDSTITVTDNGPGIEPHELSRLTERGFTGEQGRKKGGGTGMGLYIVAELCKRMDIGLAFSSQKGAFTRVTLTMPQCLTKL